MPNTVNGFIYNGKAKTIREVTYASFKEGLRDMGRYPAPRSWGDDKDVKKDT